MATLEVEVVYALPRRADSIAVRLPEGATVADAVAASGLAGRHPEIAAGILSAGVHGRRVTGSTPLRDGDRVEIYRPLAVDPKEARRRRARQQR